MRPSSDNRVTRWQRISELLNDAKKTRVILVLILGGLGSIPLVFLTPPFQVPDEVQHFYRAYQLSGFQVRAEVQNGDAGGTLPESLPLLVKSGVRTVQSSEYTRNGILYAVTPAPLAKTLKLASIPLNESTQQFVAFPGSAFYSPLPYLPQALGIALGRLFGLGPLYLFYLGRLFNCLAALALVGLAVNSIPAAEELVMLVGLLPMSLYLYASLSADAAVISCALLFTALSYSASTRGNWKTWELVTAAAAATVFCSVKPVYAPLLLAGAVPGIFRPGKAAGVIRSHAILLAVAMGTTAGWLLFARSAMTTPLDGAHPWAQMSLVLYHPTVLARAIGHTLGIGEIDLIFYVETVGVFGWVSVLIQPGVVYLLPLINFVIVWALGIRGTVERSVRHAFWCIALVLTSAILVMTAMYLMWTHVAKNIVMGVQGRYFIPALCMAGIALMELTPRRTPAPAWRSLAIMASIIVVQIVATDTTIIRAFHVL